MQKIKCKKTFKTAMAVTPLRRYVKSQGYGLCTQLIRQYGHPAAFYSETGTASSFSDSLSDREVNFCIYFPLTYLQLLSFMLN